MAREIHDHYFRQAKRDGYLSRAAYKLIEIDDRKKILRKGDRVLDCGAAPGSWLQVASARIGEKGCVVGIDLKPIKHDLQRAGVCVIHGDLRDTPADTLLEATGGELFDVVLSDMAPDTTGDRNIDHHQSLRLCQDVLDRCDELLSPGGRLVMKVFEGEAYPDLLTRTRELFESVKGYKPKASRAISREMYIIAHGFRGPGVEQRPDTAIPKRRRPSLGWK